MDDATNVLQALRLLTNSATDSAGRRQADKWLQAWRLDSKSWRICLMLLDPFLPLGLDSDRFFFASALRFACYKDNAIIDPAHIASVLDQLSLALLANVCYGAMAVVNQLTSSLSALAVRCQASDAGGFERRGLHGMEMHGGEQNMVR